MPHTTDVTSNQTPSQNENGAAAAYADEEVRLLRDHVQRLRERVQRLQELRDRVRELLQLQSAADA